MNMKKTFIISICVILALVIAGILIANSPKVKAKREAYVSFASCINDSGTTYYGAFWCPNCQKQKAMFKQGGNFLPYTECSTPDGKGTLQVCIDAEIKKYPTWNFPDGTRVEGVQTFENLSKGTSCPVPEILK